MGLGVFLGLATVDIIYALGRLPSDNEKTVARRQEILCGGPATNAAITYAFLGGCATLVSAVGTHPLAHVIRSELEHCRASLQDLTPSSGDIPPVSSIFVIEGTGSRTVVSGHATRKRTPPDAFETSVLQSASILLVDGHHIGCAIKAAVQAKALGIPVVLDGGSWKDRTDELLAHTRNAICSENFRPPGAKSASDVIAYLLSHGPEAVAITRGPNTIIWATQECSGEVSAPVVSAVDTLGAGDVFHGAFCHRLVSGAAFTDALSFAAQVASYSCEFFGTRSWMNAWPPRMPGAYIPT